MLQPLDVGVNCPSKAEMQRFWCDWIAEGEHTKTGRKRRGEVSVIVILIVYAAPLLLDFKMNKNGAAYNSDSNYYMYISTIIDFCCGVIANIIITVIYCNNDDYCSDSVIITTLVSLIYMYPVMFYVLSNNIFYDR